MPTLFGSEYLLPAIVVVVLLLALLLMMSRRRRAAGGAVPKAPKKAKARRQKQEPLVETTAVAGVEEEVVFAPVAEATSDMAAVSETAVASGSGVWIEPVVTEAPAPVTSIGMMAETEAEPVAEMESAAETESAPADTEAETVETPMRSPRRGFRITVRTQAAGAGVTRPDPLQAALVDILGGWGDLSPEDTKRLELFRPDKVVAAIAVAELPKAKSGDYARTRLTQLRQYAVDLERRSQPLQPAGVAAMFVTAPLGAGGSTDNVAMAPAPPLVLAPVETPVVSDEAQADVSPSAFATAAGTAGDLATAMALGVGAWTALDSATDTSEAEIGAQPSEMAPEIDLYGDLAHAATDPVVVDADGVTSEAEPGETEPWLYGADVHSTATAIAAAKLPEFATYQADVDDASLEDVGTEDDLSSLWAESPSVWMPTAEPEALDDREREMKLEETAVSTYREIELDSGSVGAISDERPADPSVTDPVTDQADALSRLSVKVETAQQLLALPPDEQIEMTAFLQPAELAAAFRATEDPELKKAVIDTLEHIGSPASLTALGNCFDDTDGGIQLYALEAADRLLGIAS
jgi:hypothetical protein